ncbi:MAG: NUDIX hydrolase [Nitrososphaerota archaeon]|jgi:ADP-ribose pyrophosphatase|nr:NUDIX hydrolase [Nitrososphaerota archaeon]
MDSRKRGGRKKDEETLESRLVHTGRYLKVRVDRVRSGKREITYDLVEHPGAVAVLPVTQDGQILLERQYRHALGVSILEIPAGTLEPGEKPVECAKRELIEETGFAAVSIRKLGVIYMAPGYSNEVIHIFFARIKSNGRGPSPEPDESITISEYAPDEVMDLVKSGKLMDAKSLAALFIAERLQLLQL